MLPRVGFAGLGIGALGYGAWLMWQLGAGQWLALAKWLAGGVFAHDLLLAPLVIVLGLLATRLPSFARAPVVVAVVVWGSITILAIPMLGRFGADPTLPSLLDRPYLAAWSVGTAVVLLAVAGAALVRRRRQS